MDPNSQKLDEIHRLTKENNRMLHSMRRNAFWWGVIKILLYLGLLVALPLWLYATYLAPIVESTMATMEQMQGTGTQTQLQFENLQNMLKQFDLTQYFGQ